MLQRIAMETALQAGVASAGACARVKFQAMPYSVTLCTSGFLQIMLMWLPAGVIHLYGSNDSPWFGLLIYFFTCVVRG